jgi:hypothetical protein
MKKETIEYFRDNNNIFGYGYSIPPKEIQETSILDFLCKWSKNKKVKIYSHSLKRIEENISKTKFYEFRHNDCPPKDIPYCDWVYYLDIYYQ